MNSIEDKWWFSMIVALLTVSTTVWLFSAVGLDDPFEPTTFSRVLLFAILIFTFRRFYSFWFRMALALREPSAVERKNPTRVS